MGGLLNALEQKQLADVQAEPQTTVLNNLPAEIFVGERTPIRVLDVGADQAQATATVQLIETGIILDVTPHITPTGKVLMELHAERSGVAVNDPAMGVTFNTQRARTQILVNNGETAVIGGLTGSGRLQEPHGYTAAHGHPDPGPPLRAGPKSGKRSATC